MSAMLPNPLTPPQDDSVEFRENGDSSDIPIDPMALLATPTSFTELDLYTQDLASNAEEEDSGHQVYDQDVSDDDMTDGGAALDQGTSNVDEDFNESLLQMTDTYLGEDSGDQESLPSHYSHTPPNLLANIPQGFFSDELPDSQEPTSPPELLDEMPQGSILPTMNSVTEQLEHLQGTALGHANLLPLPAEQLFLPNYSNIPLSLFSILKSVTSLVSTSLGESHPISLPPGTMNELVSMVEAITASSVPVTTALATLIQSWSLDLLINDSSAYFAVPGDPFLKDLSHTQSVASLAFDEVPANGDEVDDRANFGLGDFLQHWATRPTAHLRDLIQRRRGTGTYGKSNPSHKSRWAPSLTEVHAQRYPSDLPPIKREDLNGEECDIQRLDWQKLGVSRVEARDMRQMTYKNYTNMRSPMDWHPYIDGMQLRAGQNFFKFRQMNFDHQIFLSHFQLRNMVSCASRNHIFYAGKSKVYQWDPTAGQGSPKFVAMNLTNSTMNLDPVQISTLTVDHNILFVGGFCGEYSMVNLRAHKDTKPTEGIVTYHENAITNHVQVHQSRGSYMPQAAIASNDSHLRVLDVATNTIVADHGYDHAINCTALSPDQRLRVLVGDAREVMICNSETGEVLQRLEGHQDYGFACDWADDGWTVATGNQDMLVKIWDARKWTNSSGLPNPLTTIAADMAGVRKLKFSPLGSGKRVLVAAEAADTVNVIDAETFRRKQALTFFGEVGGFDFTNGGRNLFIACFDEMRGGIMEFERANLASSSMYEIEDLLDGKHYTRRKLKTGLDWRRTDEDVTFTEGSWGTVQGRRKGVTAALGDEIDYF